MDAIRRATDIMMAGKVAVVGGYGDVGKKVPPRKLPWFRRARVIVTEIDPICPCRPPWTDSKLNAMIDAVKEADIIVTAGCRDLITAEHFKLMKDKAIVCNIGHFDIEIDMAWLNNNYGHTKNTIKPQVDLYTIDGKRCDRSG